MTDEALPPEPAPTPIPPRVEPAVNAPPPEPMGQMDFAGDRYDRELSWLLILPLQLAIGRRFGLIRDGS